jgi:hypothetical protein
MSLGVNSVNYGYTPYVNQQRVLLYNDPLYANRNKDYNNTNATEKQGKSGSLLKGAGLLAAVAIGADIVFFKGKHIKSLLGKLGINFGKTAEEATKGATKTAKTPLEKAKGKEWSTTSVPKKQRIKNTSNTGAREPITNEQEAKIVKNINTQHVDGKTRKLVEQAERNTVTAEQQAAYDREIAYRPLDQQGKKDLAQLRKKNAEQSKELNSIKNNSKGGENLQQVKQAAKAEEKIAKTVKDGAHVNQSNQNIYFTKDGKVTQIRLATPNSKGEYVVSDPVKIAKHLAKHNVNISEFAA